MYKHTMRHAAYGMPRAQAAEEATRLVKELDRLSSDSAFLERRVQVRAIWDCPHPRPSVRRRAISHVAKATAVLYFGRTKVEGSHRGSSGLALGAACVAGA